MAQVRRTRKWSAKVMATSDALDLEKDLFRARDPKRIAASLKRSAERSKRRKGTTLSIGHVDVDVLHQSRRQEPAGNR